MHRLWIQLIKRSIIPKSILFYRITCMETIHIYVFSTGNYIYHTYLEKYVFNSQFGKTSSLSIPQDLVDFLSGFGNKAIGGVGILIYVQHHTCYPFLRPHTFIYIYTWYISNTDNRKGDDKSLLAYSFTSRKDPLIESSALKKCIRRFHFSSSSLVPGTG